MVCHETCFAGRHCPDLAYAGGTKFAGGLGLNLSLGMSLAGVVWLWIKYPRPNPALFAISWILTGFLPVVPACLSRLEFGIIIEPHWLIFSSIGYFLLLAIVFSRLKDRVSKRIWYCAIAVLLCSTFLLPGTTIIFGGSNKILPLLAHGIAGSLLAEFLAGIRLLGGQEL